MDRNNRESGRILESKKNLPEFAVVAQDIHKQYTTDEKDLEVIKGIHLEVRTGEIVSIMGPSGAGKSTLLHLLGLMDEISSGELTLLGYKISEIGIKEKEMLRSKYIGFLFQFHSLLPEFTLLENVSMPLRIQGKNRRESCEKAKDILSAVGLEQRWSHLPAEVSGGEQQRAALARAMVQEPALLLCDEPTGNLDLERGEEIRELIWRMARSHHSTVLIATHNPEIAKNSDKIIPLVDGRIRSLS